jgi:large subunit ribosomal protein L9
VKYKEDNNMKVILLQDVKGVGKKDQIVNASEGYAKNFLFPKNLALEANNGNMKQLDNKKKAEAAKAQEELEKAQALAAEIEKFDVKVAVKIGENGKLFGAVTNKEIAAAIKEQYSMDIDKKKIVLADSIKATGEKEASVKLHPKVTAKLKVTVEGVN